MRDAYALSTSISSLITQKTILSEIAPCFQKAECYVVTSWHIYFNFAFLNIKEFTICIVLIQNYFLGSKLDFF